MTVEADSSTERTYVLSWQEPSNDPEKYQAFASSLSGRTVMNVRERGDGQGKWAFLRYSLLRDNVLYFEMADYKLFEKDAPSSVARARAVLSRGGADAFKDCGVCIRAGDREPR